MELNRTVTVLGGDTRQIYAALRLKELGYSVCIYGFEEFSRPIPLKSVSTLDKAMASEIIVLPLPVTRNNKTLNASFSEREILLKDITALLCDGKTVLFGMGSEAFHRELNGTGAACYDYFGCEELTVKNALLTAEALVGIVIEKLPLSVAGMKIAVTGYGRVGYFTAKLFKALGAEVTVWARNSVQLAKAQTAGLKAENIREIKNGISNADCIINTVPSVVIDKAVIEKTKKDCLIIEAASAPCGIDFDACRELDRTLVKAFSLPGKTSPKTAGIYIADTVNDIVKEVL